MSISSVGRTRYLRNKIGDRGEKAVDLFLNPCGNPLVDLSAASDAQGESTGVMKQKIQCYLCIASLMQERIFIYGT